MGATRSIDEMSGSELLGHVDDLATAQRRWEVQVLQARSDDPFHHRVKTHADWDVQQPYPGIYVWRDPHGASYLVDHTGTCRITQAA